MIFKNREDAAARLAEKLADLRDSRPLVLGIPRGGVVMAGIIARALGGEADVVLVHKLRHPIEPEVAIGSIDESGRVFFIEEYAQRLGVAESYIVREASHQQAELQRRRALYTPARSPLAIAGRVVVVVDDGLATGATMLAALGSVRQAGPARLVAAAAVAPPDTAARIKVLADEWVCLHVPRNFYAVGQYFQDFNQVEDAEVVRILRTGGGADAC